MIINAAFCISISRNYEYKLHEDACEQRNGKILFIYHITLLLGKKFIQASITYKKLYTCSNHQFFQ